MPLFYSRSLSLSDSLPETHPFFLSIVILEAETWEAERREHRERDKRDLAKDRKVGRLTVYSRIKKQKSTASTQFLATFPLLGF